MEAVLEFLRKNGFVEAESALREDITERQNLGLLGCDGLPRLPLVRIVLGNQSSANLNDSDDSSSSIDSAAFMSSGSYDNLGLGSDFSPSGLCKSEGSFDTLSEFGTARDSEINNPCLLWDSDTYFYNENHKQAMPLDSCFGAQDITNCLSEDKFVTTLEVEGACKDRQEQFQQLTSLYLNSSELPITSSTNHIETNLEKQLCFPMSNTSIDHAKDHEDLEIFEMIRENEGCQYRGLKTLPEHGRCEDFTEGYSCSPTCCDCCDKLSGFYGEESGALDYDCHARGQAKDSIFSLCGCNGLGFDDQNSFKEGKLTNFELKHEEGNPTSIAWEKDMMQCSRHSENSAGNWQKVSAVLPKMELPRRSDTNRDYASDDKDRGASMNSLVTSSETDVKGYDFSRDSCLHVGIAELPSEADGNDVDELDGREMISVRHDPYTINDEEEHCINNELHMLENHEDEYEIFDLRIIHRKNRTGFEENKDLPIVLNTIIAGRYYVTEYLGSAAFSRVIQAHDLQTGMDVCMKIIKNDKDYFDQSLDEIKLLKFVNRHDPADKYHVLRLYDYFYHQEHLFIVCELLRANLYEFQKFNQDSGGEVYFTLSRLQAITRQCLEALEFLHHLGIIHCDLKPENILIKSYSRCEVKVIDLGSSCFQTDNICLYVQSRSYRAPEVILGLPYDQKIDVWSLGCILVELYTGDVLFPNDSLVMMLARMIGMLGAIDMEMLLTGKETSKYFTNNYDLYHTNEETGQLEYIIPKKSSLARHLGVADVLFIGFIRDLLQINPQRRPTAREALEHPWLFCQYE